MNIDALHRTEVRVGIFFSYFRVIDFRSSSLFGKKERMFEMSGDLYRLISSSNFAVVNMLCEKCQIVVAGDIDTQLKASDAV